MLPPVLELHVIWHPDDDLKAQTVAKAVIDHYHGNLFSGLIGGAVEVCLRSIGWTEPGAAPRPILLPGDAGPPAPAAYLAVVVLLGNGMARALLGQQRNEWRDWLEKLKLAPGKRVCVLATALDRDALLSPSLAALFSDRQLLATGDPLHPPDPKTLLRDLSQTLAQFLDASTPPITVFVSHTKHLDGRSGEAVRTFTEAVRSELRHTRLGEFFDSHSIQAGDDWAEALKANAATGAMLSLRTDRYAGREWCQREVVIAKTHGVPVVVLDALDRGEERGSFLLDHMPRLPARRVGAEWNRDTILRALGLLVDECLKRALWRRQRDLAGEESGVAWWAPHAPEPLTLVAWLTDNRPRGRKPVIVLHPDPPLTRCERDTIESIAVLAGLDKRVEVLTPRTFAARGGGKPTKQSAAVAPLLPRDALAGRRLGLSASDECPDMARLGLTNRHFRLALGEMARLVLVGGGTLAWGGHLHPDGLTPFLIDEVRRYGRKERDPLLVCLAWSVHRAVPLADIEEIRDQLGLYGRLVCLDVAGAEIDPGTNRGEAPAPVTDCFEIARGLSAMRQYLIRRTDGRLMMGGRRANFQGRRPGLIEEAQLALQVDQPLYLAAGFGGATADIARAAGFDMSWLPPDHTALRLSDDVARGLEELRVTVGTRKLRTGLNKADITILTRTHRPSEIATLVSRGLARVFAGKNPGNTARHTKPPA